MITREIAELVGGAEALNRQHHIGNFCEGKSADFTLFEREDFSGSALATYVAGKKVWKAS